MTYPNVEGPRHPVALYDGAKNLLLIPILILVLRRFPAGRVEPCDVRPAVVAPPWAVVFVEPPTSSTIQRSPAESSWMARRLRSRSTAQ